MPFNKKSLKAYGALLNQPNETNPLRNEGGEVDGRDLFRNDGGRSDDTKMTLQAAMNSAAAASALEFANKQLKEIRALATDGPLSFQVLAMLGGVAMTLQSVFGSLGKFMSFSPLRMLIELYCGIFGLLIFVLEGKRYAFTLKFQKIVHEYAKFLSYTWGRGLFYMFAGSLMFSQVNMMDMLVGGYMVFIGATSVVVGRHTASKLTDLKHTMGSEKVVKAKFNEMDKDGNGSLDSRELAALCASLGSPLDHNELCASISVMDIDGNGKISWEEFYNWWAGWKYEKDEANYDDYAARAQFSV